MNLISRTVRLSFLFRLIAVFCSLAPQALSQILGEKVGPQFPFLTGTARTIGMADAGAAIIDLAPGFGSNPGVLGFLQQSTIDFSSQRIKQGVTYEHIGVVYKATPVDAIAFGLDVLHYGGTDFYTKGDIRDLGFELRTGLSYGRRLGSSFSLGINLQALTATTGPTSVWAFVGDIGFAYAPEKYIRYGFYLTGIGTDYKITTSILPTDLFTSRIARVLGLSIALDFPFSNRTKRIVVAVQNEKILGERNLLYKLGIEYYPFWSTERFRGAIRGGFLARDLDVSARFGLGIGYGSFSLDYAYQYARKFNQPSHITTLSFMW